MSSKKPKFEKPDLNDLKPEKQNYEPVDPPESIFKAGDVVVIPTGESGTVWYVVGTKGHIILKSGHIVIERLTDLTPFQT